MNQANQPISMTANGEAKPRWKVPALKGMSVVHIALGGLSAVLGIVAVVLRCHASYIGFGIWSGLLFFCVTGIIGLLASHQKNNRGLLIAYLVMAIISAVLAFQMIVACSVSAAVEFDFGCSPSGGYGPYGYEPCIVSRAPRIAIDALLAVLGLAEMVISIVSSSLSCYGICSCTSYAPVVVHYVPQQTGASLVPLMPMQQQQQQQQQLQLQQQQALPVRVPTPVQGGSPSAYVAGVTGVAQPGVNAPQQMAYAPQPVAGPPVGAPQQVLIASQPGGIAPQHTVMIATPGQAPAATAFTAGGQTVKAPDAHSGQTGGGNEHFHHDDKQGLLDTV